MGFEPAISDFSTLKALICLWKPWRPKGYFQFEIIINVLVSSFQFIWIPMLWVYHHYKYAYSYSAGIDFRRQNLTSTDVRFWRLMPIPALYGLNLHRMNVSRWMGDRRPVFYRGCCWPLILHCITCKYVQPRPNPPTACHSHRHHRHFSFHS